MKRVLIVLSLILVAALCVSFVTSHHQQDHVNRIERSVNSPSGYVTVTLSEWEPYPLEYFGNFFIEINNVEVSAVRLDNGEVITDHFDKVIGGFSANADRSGSNLYFIDEWYNAFVSFYYYPSCFKVHHKCDDGVWRWIECEQVSFTYSLYDVTLSNPEYCEIVGFPVFE